MPTTLKKLPIAATKTLIQLAQHNKSRLIIINDAVLCINGTIRDHRLVPAVAFTVLREKGWVTAPKEVAEQLAECFITTTGMIAARSIIELQRSYVQLELDIDIIDQHMTTASQLELFAAKEPTTAEQITPGAQEAAEPEVSQEVQEPKVSSQENKQVATAQEPEAEQAAPEAQKAQESTELLEKAKRYMPKQPNVLYALAYSAAEVTQEQITRCYHVQPDGKPAYYLVESEHINDYRYKVTYDRKGFQCTCTAGKEQFAQVYHPSGVCPHVRWTLAASMERRAAAAQHAHAHTTTALVIDAPMAEPAPASNPELDIPTTALKEASQHTPTPTEPEPGSHEEGRAAEPTEPSSQEQQVSPEATEWRDRRTVITHYYEPDTAIHWLEFYDKPDLETRVILKSAGWRFVRSAEKWKHAGLLTPFPELAGTGYTYEEGGSVDYTDERANYYETRAQRAEQRAASTRKAADQIASFIPFGQPIMIGHHSERRHRRDLDKITRNMRKSFAEQDKAERLHDRAEASQSRQEQKHDPGAIARRLERIRKDWRVYEHATSPEGQRCRNVLSAEISRLEAELEAVGGLPAEQEHIAKGEVILIEGHLVEVVRVNKKTITGYLISPVHNLYSQESGYTKRTERNKRHFDITCFAKRLYTAQEWSSLRENRSQADAYAIAQAHLKERD